MSLFFLPHMHRGSIKYATQFFQCATLSVPLYLAAIKYLNSKPVNASDKTSIHSYEWTDISAQISFVFTAATTPIGASCISAFIHLFFTTIQLESVFGLDTIFEHNRRHPRHVFSLLGAALAAPAAIRCVLSPPPKDLTQKAIQWTALASLMISRPILHLGNELAHYTFSKIR